MLKKNRSKTEAALKKINKSQYQKGFSPSLLKNLTQLSIARVKKQVSAPLMNSYSSFLETNFKKSKATKISEITQTNFRFK